MTHTPEKDAAMQELMWAARNRHSYEVPCRLCAPTPGATHDIPPEATNA